MVRGHARAEDHHGTQHDCGKFELSSFCQITQSFANSLVLAAGFARVETLAYWK